MAKNTEDRCFHERWKLEVDLTNKIENRYEELSSKVENLTLALIIGGGVILGMLIVLLVKVF